MQRLAELDESVGRLVEHAAFVGGADDEHAHVARGRGLDGGPVLLVDVVPVQVDVVEAAIALVTNRVEHRRQRRVRRKTNVADEAFGLQLAGGGQAAVFLDAPPEQLVCVNAVQTEQVDIVELQPLERLAHVGDELRRIGRRRDLGLHDEIFARKGW